MGPSQICGCPFREPRVFTIAHIYIGVIIHDYILYICIIDYIHPSFTKLFVDDPRYSQVDQVKLSA